MRLPKSAEAILGDGAEGRPGSGVGTYTVRAAGMLFLRVDPLLRNLQGDSRYKALLGKMNMSLRFRINAVRRALKALAQSVTARTMSPPTRHLRLWP